MKIILLLAFVAVSVSCSLVGNIKQPRPSWVGKPNPLDVPGDSQPTVAELHAKNKAQITGDPVHRF